MNIRTTLVIGFIVGALATAGSLSAAPPDQTAVRHDVPSDLAKQAKISLEEARATALKRVPGGEVRSEELEREHGKLIYSFDIQVPGKSGVEEVNVSAITGKVIGKKHESARTESSEEKAKPPHHD
jgi:peptidase YpeB-like protein